jgi:hypothetical protein
MKYKYKITKTEVITKTIVHEVEANDVEDAIEKINRGESTVLGSETEVDGWVDVDDKDEI